MKLLDGLFGSRVRILALQFLLTAALASGCVSLDKPSQVQECANAGNCSDDPKRQPGPDAKEDTAARPDLSSPDKPTAKDDLDNSVPDAPADLPAESPNSKDAVFSDGRDGSSPDEADALSRDADSGLPPVEVGPDIVLRDTVPDFGPDIVFRDTASDFGPDIVFRDTAPDFGPDLAPDLGPDFAPDLGPDFAPDTSPLLTGLLIYYECEGASGAADNMLRDSSGKNNDGTLMSSGVIGSFSEGKVGKALKLNPVGSNYVSMPAAAFANVTDITIATWVYVTTPQLWQRLFDIGINDSSNGAHYLNLVPQNNSASLVFSITQNGPGAEQVLRSTALEGSVWKHVAVVLGSGQSSLYVDGAVVSSSPDLSLRPADLGTIDYAYLGKSRFSDDPYFAGAIDEFRVYSRALSADEIQALYRYTGP